MIQSNNFLHLSWDNFHPTLPDMSNAPEMIPMSITDPASIELYLLFAKGRDDDHGD